MPPIRETVPFHSVPAFALALLCAAAGARAQGDAAPKDDPLAASKPRLQKALATMAELPSCAFAAKWGPAPKKGEAAAADDPVAMMMIGAGPAAPGQAKGTWTPELLHCDFGEDRELVQAGRRTIARDAATPWCVRAGKFADGNAVPFVPDAQLLFQLLQRWDLAVVHREVGTLADRPVETLTVTLNQDQVAEAYWSGMLPAGGSFGGAMMFRAAMVVAAGGGGAKPAVPKPDATVDLAFAVDPATGHVHEVRIRTWSRQDAAMGGGRVVFVGGAGGVKVAGGEDDDEEAATEPKADAPLVYENGLPVRPRKKTSVNDYTVTLRDHGTATAPALDDAAKTLLGK